LPGDSVVNKTEFTSLSSWADSIQANVELGTIIWISIFGVRIRKAQIRDLNFRAGKSVHRVSFVIRSAVCSFGVEWPVTYTFVLIEVKSRGAGVFFCYTINTSIEDVADGWFGMGVKSVETWTKIICALRLLELKTVLAINIEIMVARFPFPAMGVKYKTIGTYTYFCYIIETVIVFITK